MKILHTSDWHLGRTFHGATLLDEQAEALDRIASLVEEHQVELVVIAGDLFDRAIPPATAVRLLGDVLDRFAAAGASVAAISGNHDSPVRVGGYDALLNRMGVALRGDHRRVDEPLLLDQPRDGGPPVAVYLVPYLEPAAVSPDYFPDGLPDASAGPVESPEPAIATSTAEAGGAADVAASEPSLFDFLAGLDEPSPEQLAAEVAATDDRPRARRATQDLVNRAAVERIRTHLGTLGPARSVVVAHTFVKGGAVSASERDISVGNLERVAVDTFDGFDLVALGHLHAPQRVAGDRMAYSGTPLPYSFSEEGQTKSVRLVDLAADGSVTATVIPLEVGRPVRTLTGTLDRLLTDPAHADATTAWVSARLTDLHLPNGAMAKLRSRFPHAVELRHEPPGAARRGADGIVGAGELRRLEPLDLTLRFWEDQTGGPATDDQVALLAKALTEAVETSA